MKYHARNLLALAVSAVAMGAHQPTEAASTFTSVLSFNSSTYTTGPGQTFTVQVSLSQIAGTGMDAQVTSTSNPPNLLFSAGFEVLFNNPSGVAAVLSPSNVAGVAAFDQVSTGVTPMQNATLTETVFLGTGIGTLPAVLGTFTFTALKFGTTQISVVPLPMDFSTSLGNILSPTSAFATINVIPEPSSIVILFTGAPVLLGGVALRRGRNPEDQGITSTSASP